MSAAWISADEVIELLRKACIKAGSQKAWAAHNGLSDAYVSDVLNSRRDPGAGISKALGLECVVLYRRALAKEG